MEVMFCKISHGNFWWNFTTIISHSPPPQKHFPSKNCAFLIHQLNVKYNCWVVLCYFAADLFLPHPHLLAFAKNKWLSPIKFRPWNTDIHPNDDEWVSYAVKCKYLFWMKLGVKDRPMLGKMGGILIWSGVCRIFWYTACVLEFRQRSKNPPIPSSA